MTHAACQSEPTASRTPASSSARSSALGRILTLLAPLSLCATVLAAPVTGTITNGTTAKPSAGDTIAVVNMARSMDEIAHATSDSTGVFHLTVPDDGQILLHVTHRGADYYKTISPGATSADIEVFDSAAKVSGITGEALVLRFETDSTARTLSVSENFFVQNSSTPPRTQFGGNTFDFYLPANAQVTQSLASAPSGLPTAVKLLPIDAAQGHYAFTFPIRPGETQFQINYTLPYTGKQPYAFKLSMPTADVAVVLPKTMEFSGSPEFQPISPDPNSQSYDAHQPNFAQPITFTVAGSGQLPQIPSTAQAAAQAGVQTSPAATANQAAPGAQSPQTSATDTRPGGGMGIPDDPEGLNDPWSKYKWWILGGLGLALACGAGIMLRSSSSSTTLSPASSTPQPVSDITAPAGMYHPASSASVATAATTSTVIPSSTTLLQTLKDELFELEKDRVANHLTDTEYTQHKAALDLILRRALARTRTT